MRQYSRDVSAALADQEFKEAVRMCKIGCSRWRSHKLCVAALAALQAEAEAAAEGRPLPGAEEEDGAEVSAVEKDVETSEANVSAADATEQVRLPSLLFALNLCVFLRCFTLPVVPVAATDAVCSSFLFSGFRSL